MLSLPLSLGRTISRVHQSLLLTLTPIFILGEHGPDNMGRKWVYGRKVFTAVNATVNMTVNSRNITEKYNCPEKQSINHILTQHHVYVL